MSFTPKTDAIVLGASYQEYAERLAGHARQLERELNDERVAVRGLSKCLEQALKKIEALKDERLSWRLSR